LLRKILNILEITFNKRRVLNMAFKNAGGGLGNMSQMLKQAQKLQAEMARTQEELQNKTVEASAGGGVVQVVVSGKMEVVELKIKPEAVDPEDVEMLEDLVKAAVNEGLRKAQEMTAAEMGKLTGGLKIPGLF
jgi:DNA-binding YbaB/EbfC family protein